jgi:cytidine deaminase
VAVTGGAPGAPGKGATVTPCGRCRQMLNEVAQLGGTDPQVWCDGAEPLETTLSALLPHAFGPANLA